MNSFCLSFNKPSFAYEISPHQSAIAFERFGFNAAEYWIMHCFATMMMISVPESWDGHITCDPTKVATPRCWPLLSN
jgi:hypothetical protein